MTEGYYVTIDRPLPGLLLIAFVLLQCLLPLRTAVKIGADEDLAYAKATLWLKGYPLYTEVWDWDTGHSLDGCAGPAASVSPSVAAT